MKKSIYIAALFLLSTFPSVAQSSDAQKVINQVSAAYQQYNALEVSFDFSYHKDQNDKQGYHEAGTMVLDQQSDRYRIKMATQEYISDGKSQWLILKNEKEVQVTDVGDHGNSITPSNLFSFFQEGYRYKKLRDEQVGKQSLHVLELTPENPRQPYSRIELRVAKSNNFIYDVTLYDKNNGFYKYNMKSVNTNPSIRNQQFVFNTSEFPGLEIVDLRL